MFPHQDRFPVLLPAHCLHPSFHYWAGGQQLGHLDVCLPYETLEQHLCLHVQPGISWFLLRPLTAFPHLLLLQQNRLDIRGHSVPTAALYIPCESLWEYSVSDLHQCSQVHWGGAPAQVSGSTEEEKCSYYQCTGVGFGCYQHVPHPLLFPDWLKA